MCSSTSSSAYISASLIRNIEEFGAKNYFTDHRTANTIHDFRDPFNTRILLGYPKIWATFHSYPRDTRVGGSWKVG